MTIESLVAVVLYRDRRRQTMSELQPEELLLTVAATITENEMGSMISSSELSQLIREPAVYLK